MDNDDDDGVGFIAESHYANGPTVAEQQAMALLQIPRKEGRDGREGSVSSNVSDLDIPIYSSENLTTRSKGRSRRDFTGKLAFAVAVSAIGSAFQHGFNTGVTNNPQAILESWVNSTLSKRMGAAPAGETVRLIMAIAVAIYCVGGMLGGAVVGIVANSFGRKGGLLWNNVLVVIGAICESTSKMFSSFELFIIGRFILGINSGINAGISPMYLAEISPTSLRGAIGTVYQLVITISILIAQILGIKSILGTEDLWPILFAIILIPAIAQVISLPCCPESPKYLISKGREADAQKALSWLRGKASVNDEMDAMKTENDAIKALPKVTMREMFVNKALRIPLIISLTIMCAQQLSGINAVIFFSTEIFEMSGLNEQNATYATMGMGTINVLMTVVSLFLVELAGRKTLLLVGFSGMFVDTLLLTFGLIFAASSTIISYLCIGLVFVYIILFATGPGSIPWFLVTELFNQSARPAATSMAVFVNWTANFMVGLSFLPIKDLVGPYVFIIFVVLDALFVVFIYFKVPETKNRPIEEITAMFRQQSYQ